jgi:predicted hydrocarbon binding protein
MPESTGFTLRLKGNIYARPDFFKTDVKKGVTRSAFGTRMCALTSDFLLGFRDALIYECGRSFAPVLKACGRRWGEVFIRRFDRELSQVYQASLADLPAGLVHTCLAEYFAAHGWGQLAVDLSKCSSGLILVRLKNSVLPDLIRESDRPVDYLFTGAFAAIFSFFAGTTLDALQTDCPTVGGSSAQFLVTYPDRVERLSNWLDTAPQTTKWPGHDAILRFYEQEIASIRQAEEPKAEATEDEKLVHS